ncbi:hypothetical protein ABE10_06170 [Bacillus toyonensis]|nr:hypothetical protein [Bacillus toyonensis]
MKWAKEQTTTTRKSYVQATRLIGGRSRLNLAALRDIVAATENYDEHSEVLIEQTSVSVIETTQSRWRERGRAEAEGGGTR